VTRVKRIHVVFVISIIAVLLLSAVGPSYAPRAQASSGYVQLIVDNRTTSPLKLRLEGPALYRLQVAGGDLMTTRVLKGSYDYTISGCGMTVRGELSLPSRTKLILPVCGARLKVVHDPKVDLSEILKVVPVKISNDLNNKVVVIMTGPSTYVFTMKAGQDLLVTIGKGTYKVQYTACGVAVTRTWVADKNTILTIRCP